MFREYFPGLREFGISSELGVSSLSVPEEFLRRKKVRTGAGSSLPYIEGSLVFYPPARSSVVPPFVSCRSKPMEPPPLPFVPLKPTRTKDGVVCLLWPSTSLTSMPLQSQVTTPNPSPPTTDRVTVVGGPSESQRYCTSEGSFHHCLPPFQHCRNQLCSNLFSPNCHQCSSFQMICQTWLKLYGGVKPGSKPRGGLKNLFYPSLNK